MRGSSRIAAVSLLLLCESLAFWLPFSPVTNTDLSVRGSLDSRRRTLYSSATASRTRLFYVQPQKAGVERDYYSILGVARTASDAEIKTAYRRLAKLYHPDANPDRDTTAQFQMLNRAYEVLRDPKLRKSYDMFGSKGIGTSAASDNDNLARANRRTQQNARTTQAKKPYTRASTRASSTSDGGYSSYVGKSDFSGSSWNPSAGGRPSSSSQSTPFRGGTSVKADDTMFSKGMGVKPKSSKKESTRYSSGTSSFDNEGFGPSQAWPKDFSVPKNNGRKYQQDMSGHMGEVHVQAGAGSQFRTATNNQDDFVSGEAFFGRGPKFGKDVLVDVEIDVALARSGGNKTIEVKHMKTCGSCQGTGTKVGSSISVCPRCGGSGHFVDRDQRRQTCTQCDGLGQVITNPCDTCGGRGIALKTRQMLVKIPKGIDDGYNLRIPGEGDAGPNGGPSGDLYVCFQIPELAKQKAEKQMKQTTTGASTRPASVGQRKAPAARSVFQQARPKATTRNARSASVGRRTATAARNPYQRATARTTASAVRPNSVGRRRPQAVRANTQRARGVNTGTRAPKARPVAVKPDSIYPGMTIPKQKRSSAGASQVGSRTPVSARAGSTISPNATYQRAMTSPGRTSGNPRGTMRASVSSRAGASVSPDPIHQGVSQGVPKPKATGGRRIGGMFGGIVNRVMKSRRRTS